jgi:nucleoside-diphosphate-sugar epimerase
VDEGANTGLLGANSLVGECVIPRLSKEGRHTVAFSRHLPNGNTKAGVTWLRLSDSLSAPPEVRPIKDWLCVAPIWVLPQYFGMIEACGARRVVALSSTSLFVKNDSSDHGEQHIARRLAEGEQALRAWAEAHGIEWVILRPTLIYGRGRDKNLTEIVCFVRRWGFFPLLGEAKGLRQPVHAEDIAAACVSALTVPAAANRTYTISGGETLPYREMVCLVFAAVGIVPHLVKIPRWMFQVAVAVVHLVPRYRHWTVEMADRMNRDLVFDHGDAARDLGFSPRSFMLSPEDLPV